MCIIINRKNRKISVCLIVICSLFILSSCNERISNRGEDDTLHFDVSNWNRKQIIPDRVIKQVRFIPLETTQDNLIGNVNKILTSKDKLYVLDVKYGKKILIFNKKGKYLNSIGSYGRGEGEYISLNDFIVDEQENRLLILDSDLRKILTYSLTDGRFLDELKINFLATNFAMLGHNILIFYSMTQLSRTGDEYSIARLDLKDNSYKWFLKKDEYDKRISTFFLIFQSENIYYTPFFRDIVYKITENEVKPFATFNFGKDKIPGDKLKKIRDSDMRALIELMKGGDWTCNIHNFIEGNEFITFNMNLKGHHIFVIFSKKSGNYLYGDQYEGLLSKARFIQNIAVDGNEFISVVDAISFKKMKSAILENGDEETKAYYLQTLNTLSDQSNPVIISIEYNNF